MFAERFAELAAIGRHEATGGIHRHGWNEPELAARQWFSRTAADLGLEVEQDRNGNLWAWWTGPGPGAIATGSHLDSVAGGGEYDGALGVVCAFTAVEALQDVGHTPKAPIAVVAFVEEEGSRFGVPTLGSRLATGAMEPERARSLTDQDGLTLAAAMAAAGTDPAAIGADPERLAGIAAFVELHIEQGRGLADAGAPVGVIGEVWPHGRWRLDLEGRADHAGTSALDGRADALVAAAEAITGARAIAATHRGRATVGRIRIEPNVTNTVPGRASLWLDARAHSGKVVDAMVDEWAERTAAAAAGHGVRATLTMESVSDGVLFDERLIAVLLASLEAEGITPTVMATAAGHDAAILAGSVRSAMLHVRNRDGVSHAPEERADEADCETGVRVLAEVLRRLTS